MKGVAHISFAEGGGVVLPARSAYDRDLLVEHIAGSVRSKGCVRVAVDDRSWSVLRGDGPSRTMCDGCGYELLAACCSASDGAAYCLRCAFGQQPHDAHVERHVMR